MSATTALLVIDMQVGLVEAPEPVFRRDEVLATVGRLVAQARAAGAHVVYVQDNDVGAGIGSEGWQIHPALAPQGGELVVRKPWADSFYETDLHDQLASRGVTRLVTVGMKTDFCVDATVRQAVARGYDVVLVADAHTTTDNRVLTAEQTVAYHNDLLWEFGKYDAFGRGDHWVSVVPSAEVTF